jgi:hypothetical protein
MKVKKHVETWATLEHDEGTFRLEFQPDNDDVEVRVVGNRAVVGYLCHDEDCPNPLEDCDGMGHIYTSHRHDGQAEEFQQALGLSSEWRPDLEAMVEQAQLDVVKEAVEKLLNGETVFSIEDAGTVWVDDPHVNQFADVWFVVTNTYRQVSFHDYHRWTGIARAHVIDGEGELHPIRDWEDRALELWHEGRKAGTIGNPYAVSLDVYDHSGRWYAVSHSRKASMFPDQEWDVAHGGGVWVPDKCLVDELESYPVEERRAKAREFAAQACEEYTAWSNGDCWGYVTQTFTRTDAEGDWEQSEQSNTIIYREDGVTKEHTYTSTWEGLWGMIGCEYARSQMAEEVERIAKEWHEAPIEAQPA